MSFRPTSFKQILGQQDIINTLSVSVKSAKLRGDALGHVLFSGPPGLGKTTFSQALASELGVGIEIANGATFRSPKTVVPYLISLEKNSILFIDEIHRMTTNVAEFLYPVMEDFKLNITAGKSHEDKVIAVPIPNFTLIGATTEAGSLAAPLRDRFKHKFTLQLYDVPTLTTLLKSNAQRLNININDMACKMLSQASRGTPRIANSLIEWVRDIALVNKINIVNEKHIEQALTMKKIGLDGSTEQDRKYLDVLSKQTKPIGIKTLVSLLNIDRDTIENVIEPFLLRQGSIRKTSKGREIV